MTWGQQPQRHDTNRTICQFSHDLRPVLLEGKQQITRCNFYILDLCYSVVCLYLSAPWQVRYFICVAASCFLRSLDVHRYVVTRESQGLRRRDAGQWLLTTTASVDHTQSDSGAPLSDFRVPSRRVKCPCLWEPNRFGIAVSCDRNSCFESHI